MKNEMVIITEEEYLRFQNGTLKNNNVCGPNLGLQNNMINNLKSQSGTSSLNNNYDDIDELIDKINLI